MPERIAVPSVPVEIKVRNGRVDEDSIVAHRIQGR